MNRRENKREEKRFDSDYVEEGWVSGWQTREVDTCTVRTIYMYRVERAKDGRDQGPERVKWAK